MKALHEVSISTGMDSKALTQVSEEKSKILFSYFDNETQKTIKHIYSVKRGFFTGKLKASIVDLHERGEQRSCIVKIYIYLRSKWRISTAQSNDSSKLKNVPSTSVSNHYQQTLSKPRLPSYEESVASSAIRSPKVRKRMEKQLTECLKVGTQKLKQDPSQALFKACEEGKIDQLQDIINQGVNLNQTNYAGKTPLMVAAEKGHLECVKLLIDNSAAVNTLSPSMFHKRIVHTGMSALHFAILGGHSRCVELLLNNGADANQRCRHIRATPIMIAAESKQPDCLKLLIKHGGGVNEERECHIPPRYQPGVPYCHRYHVPPFKNALLIAAASGCPECIEILVNNGADINCRNKSKKNTFRFSYNVTPLQAAKCYKNKQCIKLLTKLSKAAEQRSKDMV